MSQDLESLNQVLLAEQLRQRYQKTSPPFEQNTEYKPGIIQGYKKTEYKQSITPCIHRISKDDYKRIVSQLDRWGVPNSGAVVARENPFLVKQAVDITLSSLREIRTTPKKFFRGVLRNLQAQQQAS